jgi:hypothetical protein
MMRVALRLSVVGLGLALLAASGLAQQLQPQPGQEELLGGLGDKLLTKESSRLGDMRHGKKPVIDPVAKETEENKLVLTKAARFYAYRLTNPIYLEKEKNPEGLTMNDLVNQAYEKMLLIPEIRGRRALKDEQKQYLKEFTKELIPCLRDVLSKNGKPIVRVNAVRILAGLGEVGQEDVADTLREIIVNPKENDGVKEHAFKGLGSLFEIGGVDKASIFQKADREAACIKAVVDYVGSPRPAWLPADAPPDEVGAYQYIRREALRTLAVSRYPLLRSKDGEIQTATWLHRALKKELDPETTLTEQTEAAIGLCQLQAKLSKEYSLDFAAAEVGGHVVNFIKEYNIQKPLKQPMIPWKWYTARLMIALEALNNQAKDPAQKAVGDYVGKVVEQAQKALRPLEIDKDADPTGLDDFLQKNPPASKELLKGVKPAVLKTATP